MNFILSSLLGISLLALAGLVWCNHKLSARLAESRNVDEKLRLAAEIFASAQEGMMITDRHAKILDINEAFTKLTGYSKEEVVGRSPSLLKSDRQDKAFYQSLWEQLLSTGHWRGEIWDRRKSGEVYAEYLKIDAVKNDAGQAIYYIALFSDITLLKEQQSRLENLAYYDMLTGLPNRQLFSDRLQHAMAQADRRERILALAYIDLDGFKQVNDQHGHALGDHLLIALSQRMKHSLRESDTISRLGGDEFAVILTDLSETEAAIPLLDRLLQAAEDIVHIGDRKLAVSASIGVVFYPQKTAISGEDLLRQADQAMYEAKQAGKNRYYITG